MSCFDVSAILPLVRVAALVKQIPEFEHMKLGPDGRLQRQGLPLEMSAYDRRAVAKGVELARQTGGSCTVVTLGPASAEDVLREALKAVIDPELFVNIVDLGLVYNVTVSDMPALEGFSCIPSIPAAELAPGKSITCTGTHAISAAPTVMRRARR